MNIDELLKKLLKLQNLSVAESKFLADYFVSEASDPIKIASTLTLLASKTESSEEILGFIESYTQKMVIFPKIRDAIDLAGTGGGRLKIGNISTAASFILAAMGYKIVKHGNRSFTHKQGSADALEKMGVRINIDPDTAYKVLVKTGITFLFAPLYHPALWRVSGIRKSLGFRTIFNKIGPFLNPSQPGFQVMGVSDEITLRTLSEVGENMEDKNFIFGYSEIGIDEIIYGTRNKIFQVSDGRSHEIRLDLGNTLNIERDYEVPIDLILSGKADSFIIKSVAINASTAMFLKNDISGITEGLKDAENVMFNGDAIRKLIEFKEEMNRDGSNAKQFLS